MGKKNKVRDALNEIKWRKKFNLDKTEIWYIHRGAPNNIKIISGNEILSIGRSFIETSTAMIPYHRISKIIYNKVIIFNR
jgi:uncharacterized protein (UPF0248 family)